MAWWRRAVFYQVYVRSFADSDGDGVGDLRGVIERLDYLERLGVDALWLSPVSVSPDADWGYDVADYTDVQPGFGGLAALDELVAEAGRRGLKIVLDLVPNHTSDRHPWFAEHRDWYVWADPKPDGSPPNNWRSAFGGGPVEAGCVDGTDVPAQLPSRTGRPELVDSRCGAAPDRIRRGGGAGTVGRRGVRRARGVALRRARLRASRPGRPAVSAGRGPRRRRGRARLLSRRLVTVLQRPAGQPGARGGRVRSSGRPDRGDLR